QQKLKVIEKGISLSHQSDAASLAIASDRLQIAKNLRFFYNPGLARELDLSVEARLDGSVGAINIASESHRVGRPDLTSISLRLAGNLSLGALAAFGTDGASSVELVRGDLNLGFRNGAATLDTSKLQSLQVGGMAQFFASGEGNSLELSARQSLVFNGGWWADFRGGDFSFLMAAPTIETHEFAKFGGDAASLTATIRAQELEMDQRLVFRNEHSSLPTKNEFHVEASELTLAGGFRFRGTSSTDAGAGSDRVFIETDNLLRAGLVKMTAGQGMTEFHFDATHGTSLDRLKFVDGSGSSLVALGLNVADLGPTVLKLGAGDSTVTIDNGGAADRARYGDRLKIVATGDTDITISNAKMASVNIVGGDGADRISIEGSKFTGPLIATLGAGDDSFLVETEDQLGDTAFRGIVLVHLGDGDDTLGLGSDTPRSALKFLDEAFFIGGEGLDTVASMSSAIKGIAPVVAGFEVTP
ncbi:MAG: hypothetical protein ABI680_14175, partial [Chthoniobacteraceae bacterium]